MSGRQPSPPQSGGPPPATPTAKQCPRAPRRSPCRRSAATSGGRVGRREARGRVCPSAQRPAKDGWHACAVHTLSACAREGVCVVVVGGWGGVGIREAKQNENKKSHVLFHMCRHPRRVVAILISFLSKKERKDTTQTKGGSGMGIGVWGWDFLGDGSWEDGTPPPHTTPHRTQRTGTSLASSLASRVDTGISRERKVVLLAVAHPWASASSYLSSQSLADSAATFMPPRVLPTLGISRRYLSLSPAASSSVSSLSSASFCDAAAACRACSRGFSRLSAQTPPSSRRIWPLEFIKLS